MTRDSTGMTGKQKPLKAVRDAVYRGRTLAERKLWASRYRTTTEPCRVLLTS